MTIINPSRLVTPEDLLHMPDNNTMELVHGRIVEKNVSVLSSKTELRIAFILESFIERNRIGAVYPASLGYQCFSDDLNRIRKPDVTFIRNERLATLSDRNPGYMPIVPDLAVEVISPNDVYRDVDEKIREYLAAGFPLIWIVNPDARTVMVYAKDAKPFVLTSDDLITGESILPGFSCKVGEFFPAPLPSAR